MDFLIDLIKDIPDVIQVMILSMFPIGELRAGLPYAMLVLDMPWFEALPICVIANLIPVPFIIWFLRPVFEWMKKLKMFRGIVIRLENRAKAKAERANEKEKQNIDKKKHKKQAVSFWALYMFVAIPLPGTGAWTGALVAAVMGMRLKHSFPAIAFGVLTAGAIMLVLSSLGLMALA
ncbi:MAG: small multi-drug export protein [Clostridia bacterium]|nr:small multi-drug export protein [Clostridia bacterium]